MSRCWKETALPGGFEEIFHIPPKNQGQIVTISYAAWQGQIYCSWHDQSDNERHIYSRDWKNADGDCDFWNHAPKPTRICGSERML